MSNPNFLSLDDTRKETQSVHICKPSSEPLWEAEVLLQYQPLLKADCAWLDGFGRVHGCWHADKSHLCQGEASCLSASASLLL